jgi:predicted glycogen debranching enzyme
MSDGARPEVYVDSLPACVEFGREICGDLGSAESREWLVTNGLGGFASGTVAGLLTRRYHGLLVAALDPPLRRTLLVSKFDETVEYDAQLYPLCTNRWRDGTIDPHGYRHLEKFRLEGSTPVWTFAMAEALLEKRIWMAAGANTTYVRYDYVRGAQPLHLAVKILVNYRDMHGSTHASDWRMSIQQIECGLRVEAFAGATPFYVLSSAATVEPQHEWYRNFNLTLERFRGLDDCEDHLCVGTFAARLAPGEAITFAATTDPYAELDGQTAREEQLEYEHALLDRWARAFPEEAREAPAWIQQLVLAAGQFIVSRSLPDGREGHSVIAGYHWFGDWGRDTMVALPGLALCTGQAAVAEDLLRTFAEFVDQGMLPNRFPESGEALEYNTVDGALWFVEALRQYGEATGDEELLRELFPALEEMIDCHARGTRFNIHADPADGLLHAGQPGVQLTWMDAKVGKRVVTPRIGKPVEVNALWYNALVTMAAFAHRLQKPAAKYETMSARAAAGFQRFWNSTADCCFDVIDGPGGNDAALRPNQILAVSLPACALRPEQQRSVVEVCARRLLASCGLRSLDPAHPEYRGRYAGGPQERDGAYHQGTVWGWLLGPFVQAHLRVFGDPVRAASFLEPCADQLKAYGLGTLGEIFDGDPPFAPRGCIAQAWTVAEVLRAWSAVARARWSLQASAS